MNTTYSDSSAGQVAATGAGLSPNFLPSKGFLEALQAVRRPLILTHVTPDADAIGSSLATATVLRDIGADAAVGLTAERVARKLRFMFELATGVRLVDHTQPRGNHDGIIVLDTATQKRINADPPPPLNGDVPVFNIDHHITNTDFGQHNWVDPHATSTCELIARFIVHQNWRLDPRTASLLYAGIHGDTAGFSLPCTSAESLHIAGKLVRAGADVSHLGEQLCRSQGPPEFELLRRVYDHTRTTSNGRIAYSFLTYEDITVSKCTADDIDDQVSIPRALRGVRIAMLFSEGEPGVIRVNLRGEGQTTVVEIAQRFGGGGHNQSAGVRLRGKTMEQAIREVLTAAESHLDK